MKSHRLAICFNALMILLYGSPASSQTQSQIEQHYPKLNTYRVKSNIALTVKYNPGGEACEMVLESRHWDSKEFFLYPTIEEADVLSVVEEIVPLSERGERVTDTLTDLMVVSGQSFSRSYHYQKLTIETAGLLKPSGIMSAVVTWQNRSCDK